MESKRKAVNTASSPDADDRASKRRKVPAKKQLGNETPEATTEHGIELLEQIRQARDKKGRPVATNFLTLPDKTSFPDYYEATVMPLALDTIETKLRQGYYPTLTTLESDIKRMVSNAKAYNEKGSEIFADAERIRKLTWHYMQKHNPAYDDPTYAAFPTPLPGEAGYKPSYIGGGQVSAGSVELPAIENSIASNEGVDLASSRAGTRRATSASKGPVVEAAPAEGESTNLSQDEDVQTIYGGKSFQSAQEQIITELINLKDADDQEISQPFLNLPSRKLADYYALIKTPESLKRIEKKVRGIHSRNDVAGTSDFQSWKSFEDHVGLIWRNAREYNEDGSEISNLADQLEAFFTKRMAQIKALVPEPLPINGEGSGLQRIKLKLSAAKSSDTPPQKIMLRVGGVATKQASPEKPLPSASTNGTSATVPVDRDLSRASDEESASRAPGPKASVVSPTQRQMASPALSTAAVKSEGTARPSPSLDNLNSTNPSATLNSIPVPAGPPNPSLPPHLNGFSQGGAFLPAYPPVIPPHPAVDLRWRQAGKDASDALIANVHLSTHPALKVHRPFHLDIPPSDTLAQQIVTIHLPSTHHYLHLTPTMAPVVGDRQSKLFVTIGTRKLEPIPRSPDQVDPQKPLYELQLRQGVNRIEVEMVAGPVRGTPKVGTGLDIELEKVTVFVNLLKD